MKCFPIQRLTSLYQTENFHLQRSQLSAESTNPPQEMSIIKDIVTAYTWHNVKWADTDQQTLLACYKEALIKLAWHFDVDMGWFPFMFLFSQNISY